MIVQNLTNQAVLRGATARMINASELAGAEIRPLDRFAIAAAEERVSVARIIFAISWPASVLGRNLRPTSG